MRILLFGLTSFFLTFTLLAQAPAGKKAGGASKAAAASPAGGPKFKAIWEPVPFNKDINLNAIECVGPESCYAVGDKGTILFTSDGGSKWQAQLGGDPESADDQLAKLFFLDANHGWAMSTRGKILATRDGSTWAEMSTVSGTSKGVWFLTPQMGLELENPSSTSQTTLRRTADGGKTWAQLNTCSVETQFGGLPRRLDCALRAMHFLGPNAGFAGGGAAPGAGTTVATFAKTADGGQTWATSVIPETKYGVTDVRFWNEKEGIVVLSGGEEMYWTADGGDTWTRSVKQKIWPSHAAVGGDGKIIVDVRDRGINYSFNGGRNFTSRPLSLPAEVNDVTFPDQRHGYLVGRHGMVYRYRIVPIEYTSQGMFAAMAP